MFTTRSPRTAALALTGLVLTALPGLAAAAAPDPLAQRLAFAHRQDRPVRNIAGDQREVETITVAYARIDGERVSGYLARPAGADGSAPGAAGPTPGLLVIHKWWGLNDHIRALARRLAANGYTVLAVDLYGGETARTPERARALMGRALANQGRLRSNLRQAVLYLELIPSTRRIGSLGWCFGGGWSLRTALLFPQILDAAVVYYGAPVIEPQALAALSAPVLGHFSADDAAIPIERVHRFEQLLGSAGKPHQIYLYDHAGHACANPAHSRDLAAPAEPVEPAWQRTIDFLAQTLQPQPAL